MKILYPYRSLRPSLKTQWTHLLTMVNFYHDDGDEPYTYIWCFIAIYAWHILFL